MGWIGVGVLIISGGCILYNHPPTSVIQLLLGNRVLRRAASVAEPHLNAERSPDKEDPKQDQCRAESSPSISIINVDEQKNNDSPPGESRILATTDARSPLPPDSLSKPVPSPAQNAHQSPPKLKASTSSLMPPPPRPRTDAPLRPPPSAASSLRVPPTRALSTAAFVPKRITATTPKLSRQVTLKPGHSPLDWAALTSDPNNRLRGKDAPPNKLIRVAPSLLRSQNGRKGRDAWTVHQGRVYNITPYLPFHPGGEGELMRSAGRDAEKLFMEVHPWVNWEAMLGECLVGILVAEDDQLRRANAGAQDLDEMD